MFQVRVLVVESVDQPIRLLRLVMSFGAGKLEIAATKSGFIFEPSWLTM